MPSKPPQKEKEDDFVLDITGVSTGYGFGHVVQDVDLQVPRGAFFGLIGLNGQGKTTLIKAILGLKDYDAGEIKIFGQARTSKAAKKHVAYLPERFEPPWFLTGIEFLRFSVALYDRDIVDKRIYEGADALALDPAALKRRVHTYSKGMRQKLGLLGSIFTGCDLMILDEPMSGLDPMARAMVKDMLIKTKKEGRTIFLSSHILADLDELCDAVAILHERHILFNDKPALLKKTMKVGNLERAFLQYVEKKKAA